MAAQAADETLVLPGNGTGVATRYYVAGGMTKATISGKLQRTTGQESADAFYVFSSDNDPQPFSNNQLYAKSDYPGSTTRGQLSTFLSSPYPAYQPSHVYHVTFSDDLGPATFCVTSSCTSSSGGTSSPWNGSLTLAITGEYVPPPPKDKATAGSVSGDVTVKHADGSTEPVTAATVVGRGDQLQTGVDSQVELSFPDGSRMVLHEMSVVEVADLLSQGSRQNVNVALKLGEVSAQVNPKKAYQTDFKVTTPGDASSVRGTKFSVFYDPGARVTVVRTQVHKVRVTPRRHGAKGVTVPAGREVVSTRSHLSKLARIGRAGARGGADIQDAHDRALAFMDRFAGSCGLTAPHPRVTVKPSGASAWSVTIPVQGKASGAATFRVAGRKVTPVNAVAQTIAAGCP